MRGQFTNSRGFTLVEMLIVISIIGILAAMAYPSMSSQIANMRIKSAKNSIAAAFKDAQAQSAILRKPVWVVLDNTSDNFSLILTGAEPASGAVAATDIISKTALPKSIRILDASGAVVKTISDFRVTPSGSFQKKTGSDYAPSSYVFYACDTAYKGNTSIALKFQNRSTPVAQSATTESIVCNL